jgi:ubiquinone/menaquinone biosynthesis C-methylase UbiE
VLPDDVLDHYDEQDEATRLSRSPHGRLELLRTQELLRRYLPPAPASVLDVGGGTGVHAEWLAADGYAVHLVDPVPKHVQQASTVGTFTAAVGDARQLEAADGSFDAALLLGPLYHLVDRTDRVRALLEAVRVTRPGGIVAAAAISRHMALLGWCVAGELDDERAGKLAAVLETGVHDPSLGFATAYFHLPAELADELVEAGLHDVTVLGIEGPIWPVADAAPERADVFDAALRCARMVESDAHVQSMSGHLLALGRVP